MRFGLAAAAAILVCATQAQAGHIKTFVFTGHGGDFGGNINVPPYGSGKSGDLVVSFSVDVDYHDPYADPNSPFYYSDGQFFFAPNGPETFGASIVGNTLTAGRHVTDARYYDTTTLNVTLPYEAFLFNDIHGGSVSGTFSSSLIAGYYFYEVSGTLDHLSVFDNGEGTGYSSLGASIVPETSTWAMMIGGFGMIGGALRRRKVAVAYQMTA